MNVVILGSGNTATVLAKKICNAGHAILQVYSRNLHHAAELAGVINSTAVHSFSSVTNDADLYLVAVSDQAIAEVAEQFHAGKKLVVHTAGSVSMNSLKSSSANYGVLYPLQSLRKEMQRIPEIPFLVNGNSVEVQTLLFDFARTLSDTVQLCNDEQRLQIHLAAVIASNFSNHLYALTEKFCNEHGLSFSLLYPLIKEVAERLQEGSAADLQTGPARRNDVDTIQKHIQLLNGDVQLQQLYLQLSESIQQTYHKK